MQNDPRVCLTASVMERSQDSSQHRGVSPPQSTHEQPHLSCPTSPSIVGRGPRASPGQVNTNCAPFLPSLLWEGLGVWNGVGSQLLP